MKNLLLLVTLWLIIINIFALFIHNRLNLKGDTAYEWIDAQAYDQKQSWDLISLHAKWDSFWYLDIAENGYSYTEGELSNVVFFPLYPLLIKTFSFATGGNYILAGWIVSTISLYLACIYLYKFVNEFHPKINPLQVIFLLLIFPTSFFLNSVYTESTFLFLSIASLYYLKKGNYWLTGIFSLLASFTRVTGIFLVVPLLYEYVSRNGFKGLLKPQALSVYVGILGPVIFFLFHYPTFGNYWLFFEVQSLWGRSLDLNTDNFTLFNHSAASNLFADMTLTLFSIFATIQVFRKLDKGYALYMLTLLLVTLSTGTLMSMGRYIIVLFPLFIWGANIKSELLQKIWIIISILLLSTYTALFVNGYWAG